MTTRIHSRLALIFALVLASFAQAAANLRCAPSRRSLNCSPRATSSRSPRSQKLGQTRRLFEQAGFEVQTVRITTQPYSNYVRGLTKEQALALLFHLEELARKHSVLLNIGPAVLDDQPDPLMLELLEEVHSARQTTRREHDRGERKGRALERSARRCSPHQARCRKNPRSQGTFNFAATAMLGPGAPFYPGSWHANQGGRFSVGLQAPMWSPAYSRRPGAMQLAATRQLGEALSALANDVHRISRAAEAATGWKYWGFDSTPAPLKDDSIGAAMESLYASHFGCWNDDRGLRDHAGATADSGAAHWIRGPDASRAGRLTAGAALERRHDQYRLAACLFGGVGTGLDTVPLPGDVTEEQLVRILGDMAVLAFKWKKPLTARLQPVHGQSRGNERVRRSVSGECKVQPIR